MRRSYKAGSASQMDVALSTLYGAVYQPASFATGEFCLNIPVADEGEIRQLARKFKYVVLAIVFPELLLFSAFEQNIAARSSVERLE